MSRHLVRNLHALVDLRSTEIERLEAAVAAEAKLCASFAGSAARLDALVAGSGGSGALALPLSTNCGDYKQSVMALADTCKLDLGLHEAQLAHTKAALHAAWARRAALAQVLAETEGALHAAQQARERKQHDELATQLWSRARP